MATEEQKKIRIKKAKLLSNLFLEAEFTEELPGHSKNDIKNSCTVPIHQDLKDAIQRLHIHLAIICDEVKAPNQKDFAETVCEGFFVKGFSISGSEESTGVTIYGYKEGKYGEVNLNTPIVKYETSEYPFTSELGTDIERAVYEVEQYLFHGKKAPEQQLELGLPEEQ